MDGICSLGIIQVEFAVMVFQHSFRRLPAEGPE